MLSMLLAIRKVSRKLSVPQRQSPKGCWCFTIPIKVDGMFRTEISMLQNDKFMVNTPGTCRRISLLWTKHSNTSKFDNKETIATTTTNNANRISAKSISHFRSPLAIYLPQLVMNVVSCRILLRQNNYGCLISHIRLNSRALSRVLNHSSACTFPS